jgi:hypothetical protein
MPHTDREWRDSWEGFFNSIGGLIDARAGSLPAGPKRDLARVATPLITDIRDAWPIAVHAINIFKDPAHPFLEDTLFDELAAISQGNIAAVGNAASHVPALEDSEIGKKSLEDLLGLPEWLKKALKLLNQILKLFRG